MNGITLTPEERDKLYAKARQYLQLEHEAVFHREVAALIDQKNDEEIYERFYSDLDFGTGGVRALIGGGSNRINPYNIGKISQGLANYILQQGVSEPAVVIAHDSRNYSPEFSLQAATVFAANGIRCYLYPTLRSTPQLSFSVRRLGALAGIMITASHNPPEYNGYKVYWDDGSQVTSPHDQNIIHEINKISGSVRSLPEQQAKTLDKIVYLDDSFDQAYVTQIYSQMLRPQLVSRWANKLKVVYTPLHGAGRRAIEEVAQKMGVDLFVVPEQAEPDGNFPTVKYPNPEEASAMELGLGWARQRQADLLLGSDPDADRLGIAAPVDGGYQLVTGNQLGALLLDYICSSLNETGAMPPSPAFINTIVTSPLQRKIAESYGVACHQTLTGFKHIAAKMREFEQQGSYQFIFGTEESYGYLIGTEVRDKDAVAAAAMTIEMTLWNLSRGSSVFAHLQQLYQRFGVHREHTINLAFRGASGQQKMSALMEKTRQEPPTEIAGQRVLWRRDYQTRQHIELASGEVSPITLPVSNVLQFATEDETVITVRPSGTEPKMKLYLCLCQAYGERAEQQLAQRVSSFEQALMKLMQD